jgi:hypothetical protein
MPAHRFQQITRLFAAAVPFAIMVSGCAPSSCRVTATKARDAAFVDVGQPDRSGVLEARLTWRGRALADRWLQFSVHVDRRDRAVDVARTDRSGIARVDLKKRDAWGYIHLVAYESRADRYTAAFAGGDGYCPSSGLAPIRTTRTEPFPPQVKLDPVVPPAIVGRLEAPAPPLRVPPEVVPTPSCVVAQPLGNPPCLLELAA